MFSYRRHWLVLLMVAWCAPLLLASCSPRKTAMPQPLPSPQNSVQPYGEKIRFEKGKPLQFADFALRFEGQTHVKVKGYPPGFVYENFVVTANGKSQKIIWSMGTGVLDPTDFSVGDGRFLLELKMSDFLGDLGENELVVWREKEWDEKQAAAHPTVR